MKLDLASIKNPPVRTFYMLYWPQHQILIDFFNLLPEEQYDFRLVDTTERKSDSPRESLAHKRSLCRSALGRHDDCYRPAFLPAGSRHLAYRLEPGVDGSLERAAVRIIKPVLGIGHYQ